VHFRPQTRFKLQYHDCYCEILSLGIVACTGGAAARSLSRVTGDWTCPRIWSQTRRPDACRYLSIPQAITVDPYLWDCWQLPVCTRRSKQRLLLDPLSMSRRAGFVVRVDERLEHGVGTLRKARAQISKAIYGAHAQLWGRHEAHAQWSERPTEGLTEISRGTAAIAASYPGTFGVPKIDHQQSCHVGQGTA